MTVRHLGDDDERALWREAKRRLLEATYQPPISLEEAKRIVAALPPRREGESLGERIGRASTTYQTAVASRKVAAPLAVIELNEDGEGSVLLEDRRETRQGLLRFFIGLIEDAVAGAFMPVSEVVRLAAARDSSEPELPDPGRALESTDGRFRVWAQAEEGKIRVMVEALGLASDEFAHKRIGISAWRPEAGQNDEG